MKTVKFTEMKKGSKEDYELLAEYEKNYVNELPDRIIKSLKNLDSSLDGYQVTRLEHSLQSATKAFKNGESEEMIVAALLHDIGDELAPMNHSEYAAAILKPYVSEKTHWIIKMHGLFQTYYYAHHLGGDRNKREEYKDHKYYQATVDFCENYDQGCFDPNYKSLPLEHFAPMVKKVFSRKPYSI